MVALDLSKAIQSLPGYDAINALLPSPPLIALDQLTFRGGVIAVRAVDGDWELTIDGGNIEVEINVLQVQLAFELAGSTHLPPPPPASHARS